MHGLHLLLSHEEASYVMQKYINGVGLPSSEELMLYLSFMCEIDVGCLTDLMGALGQAPVSFSLPHVP